MYKRILVPVDDSATSNRGLDEALRLAKAMRAKVRLVHVVDEYLAVQDSAFAFGTVDLLDALRKGGREALARAAALAARRGIKVETGLVESRTERVATAIVREAAKWRADLLVMGTHGRRGVSHLVLGSDAELVVRSSPVPVLLVRDAAATKRKARRR